MRLIKITGVPQTVRFMARAGVRVVKMEEDESEELWDEIFSRINSMTEGEMAVYATSTYTHDQVMIGLELGREVENYTYIIGFDDEYY